MSSNNTQSLKNNTQSLKNDTQSLNQTFLGEEALFKGELRFTGTLCINGKFEGAISTSGNLIISESGDVEADIEAETVVCEGQVKGNIVASKKVELRSNGKVIGDVQSPSLNIEVGAKLDGRCNMTKTGNDNTASIRF